MHQAKFSIIFYSLPGAHVNGSRNILNFSWQIRLLQEHWIKLINSSNELLLHKVCPEIDEDVTFINNSLTEGRWVITNHETPNGNLTDRYNDFVITLAVFPPS